MQVVGLIVFFSISGYLIAGSWDRQPHLGEYLRKRVLRIFPGLLVLVLASMFVLGPVMSRLPIAEYLLNSSLGLYLQNVVLFPVYSLPGVFEGSAVPNTVNASLWSLPAEFACYLVVPIFGLIPRRFRAPFYAVFGVGLGLMAMYLSAEQIRVVVYGTDLAQAASVWPFFMIGAALAETKKVIPLRLDVAVFALVGGTLWEAFSPSTVYYVWWFVLPYCIVALGSASTPVVRRASRFGDLSYGIYLYAFPVQQSLAVLLPSVAPVASVALTVLIATVLAFGSWHLVEKQALKLKGKRGSISGGPESPNDHDVRHPALPEHEGPRGGPSLRATE